MRLWKHLALPMGLLVGWSWCVVVVAQPPERPRGEGKEPPKRGRPGSDAPPPGPRGGEPSRPALRLDADVEAWAKTLIDKINHPHDVIRESARAGLVAIGRPALPLLQPIAEGSDGALATAAQRVIDRIEGGERFRGPLAFGPFPPMGGPNQPPFPPEGRPDGRPEGRGGDNPPFPPRGEGRPDARPEGRPPFPPRGEGRPDARPEGRPPFPPFGPGGFGQGRPAFLENAIARLDLDDKQKAQVKEIIDEHLKRMRDLFERVRDGNISREEMADEIRERNEALMKELRGVLTAEQMEKIRELLPRGPQGPGPRP